MSLDRFKQAQALHHAGFETALEELRAGRKTSHWIWYVFPQLEGLGQSSAATFYGLRDLDEACDYLRDAELCDHLRIAAEAVAEKLATGMLLADLMGGRIDSLKLVSSLTLFERAATVHGPLAPDSGLEKLAHLCAAVLSVAAAQGFPRCEYTRAHA